MVNANYIAGYSQNDFFYMSSENCGTKVSTGAYHPTGTITSDSCADNESKAKQLQSMRDEYASSLEKHNNVLKMYNRELVYTFNMIVGIGLLSYYMYVHKKSIM